jgi:hypothetical protein
MSEHITSRRAVLTGAGGIAAVGALAPRSLASPIAAEASPLLLEHRRLWGRMLEVRRELAQFHRAGAGLIPPVTALEDEHGELHDEMRTTAARILATPIQSKADILARIEVADYEYEAEERPHVRELISAAR